MALTQISKAGVKADLIDGTKLADDAVGAEHIETLDSHLLFADDSRAKFGTGGDLHVYHNGTNSVIREEGTGNLNIQTTGGSVDILVNTTETAAKFISDGAVELYFDNSKKLETFTWGTQSYGNIAFRDSDKANFGAGEDLQISHNGTQSIIDDAGSGALVIRSNNAVDIKDSDNVMMAAFNKDADVKLYHDGTQKLATTSGGIDVAGSGAFTSHIDINSDSGRLRLGNGNDLNLYHDGSNSYIHNAGGNLRIWSKTDEYAIECTPDGKVELFHNGAGKFETTSEGVKVNDSLLEIEDATCLIDLMETGSTNHRIRNGSGNFYIQKLSDDKNTETDQFKIDGGTGVVELYHNGTKKLETASWGVLHQGGHKADGTGYFKVNDDGDFYAGNDEDLKIYHDGSNSFIDNSTGTLRVRGSNIRICDTSNNTFFSGESSASKVYHNDSVKLETRTNGVMSQGSGEVYVCAGSTNAGGAGILLDGDSNGDFSGADYAHILHNTNGDLEVAARRPSGGNAAVNLKAYDGSADSLGNAFIAAHDANWSYHAFYPWTDDNRDLGYSGRRWDDIYATNSSIQTSDRNEKDNITNTDLGLSFINKLTPKSYKFKGKTRTHYGLIAQDVETVLSDISKPTSDFAGFIKTDLPVEYYTQYDESIPEGKRIGDVKNAEHTTYGLRYSEFIAPLIKAVQELSAKVTALEAK